MNAMDRALRVAAVVVVAAVGAWFCGGARAAMAPTTLIAAGSTWRYLDNGSNQGVAWYAKAFNDTAWASGPAELGYGDGGEKTVVSFGADAPNKYITTYFRISFSCADATKCTALSADILRDDGAIVYLNGQEAFRANMPAGTVTYTTPASTNVGGADETAYFTFAVPTTLLATGNNVMAVEIHQSSGGSTDISFDLKLTGTFTGGNMAPTVNAGADQTLPPPNRIANLAGTAADDGLPAPPNFTTLWSRVSGPGTVTFGDAAALSTTAAFTAPATYVLRLTASDGALQASDDLVVVVQPKWAVAGDANGDCRVDILDLLFIRNRLAQSPAQGTNWLADLNEDGSISVLDLIVVRNNLNARCVTVTLLNPYKDVNWSTFQQHRGNFHTHTESLTAAQAIDEYRSRGYSVLAITDHDAMTWPWTAYGRDPAALNMAAVQGSELSCCDNIGSFFSDAACGGSVDAALANVAAKNGLSIFNHPGRYTQTIDWYANYYRTYAHIVGLEVYNQGDRYPNDRQKWDEILSVLMPDRPVWGFANDDMHAITDLGYNCDVMILPSLSTTEVRNAMVKGQFYFTHMTSTAQPVPVIDSITVNDTAGTITITGRNYTEIRWISGGQQVGTGTTLNYLTTPNVLKYVRAELRGSTAVTCTNPFGIKR